MNLDNKLDMYLNEIIKKVIRKGQLKKKTICPVEIMKSKDGKCVMMSPTERKKRAKAAKKTGRKISSNLGLQKKAARKRAKSLKKRGMRIPQNNAPSLGTGGEQ